MKYSKLFTALLLTLSLSLTGCFAPKLDEPTSRDYETFIGEFKSLGGIKVNKTITHLFETEDGEILYTYSDRYDLDRDQYFGKELKVYGVVLQYENLDNAVFQVKTISKAPEEDEDEVNSADVEYKNTDVGFSLTYPGNWTLGEGEAFSLTSPKGDDEEAKLDQVSFASVSTVTISGEDPEAAFSAMETAAITSNPELEGLTGTKTYLGADQLMAVKFTTDALVSYYVLRGQELFAISYVAGDLESTSHLSNVNTFTRIANSFRFIPVTGEGVSSVSTAPSEPEEEEKPTEPEEEEELVSPTPAADQKSFANYSEFSSESLGFKGSYPKPWYYARKGNVYHFGPESLEEDDAEGSIQLEFLKTAPASTGGDYVVVAKKIGDTYYVFSGLPEYQNVMQIMLGAIEELE